MHKQISRYQLLEVIGAGGFATVYRAFDPSLDSEVALKVLAENWSTDPDIRTRFIQEAQLMRRLDDRRFVQIYDIGESSDGRPFFVMRLARHGTLAERFEQVVGAGVPPTGADVARLVDELAACLARVHAENIVHRDVKPSNMLIERTEEAAGPDSRFLSGSEIIVLGDFGLARDNSIGASRMTISGGTGGYAAPEQMTATGRPDARTDLYAATAVICEAVNGRPPSPAFAPTRAPQGADPTSFAEAITRGLAPEQASRPASAAEWKASFDVALRPAPSPPTRRLETSSQPGSPEPRTRSRTPWIIAATLAIIAVLVAGAIALLTVVRSDEGPLIDGPIRIVAGTDGVYTASFDGADTFRWTDPDGRTVPGSSLTLSGVIPGDLMLEVVALDESGATIGTAARTIEVVEAPNGPRIVGPDRVATGSTATYTVETDQEGTVRWVDASGTIEAPGYEIEPTREGTYRFSVVVSSPDGSEIGSTKEIDIVAP